MANSEMFGFSLESTNETLEKTRQKATKKSALASGLGGESPTMDTDHDEKMETLKPQVRFNADFDKEIQDEVAQNSNRIRKTYDIYNLFEAVSCGDVERLDSLYQYLHLKRLKLSDTLYQSYGKTVLMKALLHLKDGKNETVEKLIEISEKLNDVEKFVNLAYTNNYYKGQSALHIAIERRSLYYVELLVSKGAKVHAKACGKFFQPHNGPNFYFGELPLSLAACTNQPHMVDFLMDNEYRKADAQEKDSHGNTVLHALVVVANNSEENTEFIANMYDRILMIAARLQPDLKLEEIENKQGLTPLKMAAKTGKIGLFSHIINREFHEPHTKHLSRKFTEWVYGPVTCSLYDLASLDSCEDNSVLDILVYGSDIPNRQEMLQKDLLNQMLESKWKKFAGHMFFFNFLFYVLYLATFTVIAYNKRDEKNNFSIEHTITGYLYVSGQLLITVVNCHFFVTGIIDMKRKRPNLKTLMIDGYYEILFFFQSILFLISAGLYLTGMEEYLGFLVVSLALSWVNILYFSRGDIHMGIYSIMIQKMILSDILHFLFVYIVFLFGFSAAVVTLLIEPVKSPVNTTVQKTRLFGTVAPDVDCVKPSYRNISFTMLQLFKFTIGMGDMEFTERYKYKEVFYVLLIGYIILTYILLLNMLIALMNRTVEKTAMESTSIWKLQRAITILDMEKRLPCCLKKSLRCGVQKNLGTAPGKDSRWCFRVEEVNWNKWNINLSKIDEDPGYYDQPQTLAGTRSNRRNGGRSLRALFMAGTWQPRGYQSTETDHETSAV